MKASIQLKGIAIVICGWMVLSVTVAAASDRVYFFHNDQLGTPQTMTDLTGRTVWTAEHEPFGKAIIDQDPDGDGRQVVNNLRFPGQYYDAETGLHYNYHRDYDPSTGRYLQPDPIGLEGGLNRYVYVLNNPIIGFDPNGLWTFQIGLSLTSGVVAGYTKGGGIIFGRNPETGEWQIGVYTVAGGGPFGGASAGLAMDFTWSGNPNTCDVSGPAGTAGVNATVFGPFSVGGEINTPANPKFKPSYTFSPGFGIGMPYSGLGFYTHTTVW